MLKHLMNCANASDVVRSWAASELSLRAKAAKENAGSPAKYASMSHTSGASSARPQFTVLNNIPTSPIEIGPPNKYLRRSHRLEASRSLSSLDEGIPYYFGETDPEPLPPEVQAKLEQDVCAVYAANGIPWHVADNFLFSELIRKWIPGSRPPSSYTLSGPCLDRAAEAAEKRTIETVSGKVGTGQCDGWKNIAKTNVVSSLVTIEGEPYLVKTHDVSAQAKTAETLKRIVIDDLVYMATVLSIMVIAWCSDAGGDSKRMRKLLAQLIPWLIVLDCWAHQVNLVVGDYFKLDLPWLPDIDKATEVIKWFNNHSVALGLLRSQQLADPHCATSGNCRVLTCLTGPYKKQAFLHENSRPMVHLKGTLYR
ncbi:hypothetical protein K474DRAFT_1532519 [Panus rudis PR-1116 ss-1]|nr:hypothetical protein K474DRAFT_1532519 [Panus rudis PR-1116 ss-1]